MKAINVATPERVRELCMALADSRYISYDIETQVDRADDPEDGFRNLRDYLPSSRVVSASFTVGDDIKDPEPATFVMPLAHPEATWYREPKIGGPKRNGGWMELLHQLAEIMSQGQRIIAQNGKYDLRWTHSMTGVDLRKGLWFDPMAASYALDENEPKGLKILAPAYLGVPRWDDVNLKNADQVPWKRLGRYNAFDTLYAYRLAAPMLEELKEDARVARIYHYILMPITRELLQVERNGFKPDPDRLEKGIAWAEEQTEIAERNLLAYAERFIPDLDPEDINWHPSSKFFRIFMDKSGAPVYEHTNTGLPSWNKAVLGRLAAEGAEYVQHLLAFRQHGKDLGFFRAWKKAAEFDGRIHPTFNPMRFEDADGREKGTVTGRLSGSAPNPQQIPRRQKPVFGAEEGWLFVEADYSQIELRIAAMVFKEPSMLQAYQEGHDLHTLFAAMLTGKRPEDVTPEERQHAKAGNFGFLYGMGAQGFVNYAYAMYGLEYDIMEAQEIRTAFFKKWSKLEEGHDRVIELARRNGYAASPLGRLRRVPDITSSNDYLRSRAERQAINAVVQSTASDLMLLTIIDLGKELNPDEAKIIGTVHDSILLEIREDAARDVLTHVADVMLYPDIKRRFGAELTVPLGVEFKIGRRWADEKAKTIEVGG